jgi:hypothetical protein
VVQVCSHSQQKKQPQPHNRTNAPAITDKNVLGEREKEEENGWARSDRGKKEEER